MEKLFVLIVVGGLAYAGLSLFGKKKKNTITKPKVGGSVVDNTPSSITTIQNVE